MNSILSILLMKKRRHKEVMFLAQGYRASSRQSEDLNPVQWIAEPTVLHF